MGQQKHRATATACTKENTNMNTPGKLVERTTMATRLDWDHGRAASPACLGCGGQRWPLHRGATTPGRCPLPARAGEAA